MIKVIRLWVPMAAALTLFGCSGDEPAPPHDSGIKPQRDATPVDTGPSLPEDTGVLFYPDAFVQVDATTDSGIHPDATTSPDTGIHPDAATVPDIGFPDQGFPDQGSPDAGFPDADPVDLAFPDAFNFPDASPPDQGFPDSGVATDSGPADLGPDSGVAPPCVDGQEGCRCAFGGTCDPGLTCRDTSSGTLSPTERTQICVLECSNFFECLASSSVPGNIHCLPYFESRRACVSGEVAEGLHTNMSRIRGTAMTGCQDGLFATPFFAGSRLAGLEHDQASCGRPCNPSIPSDCTAQYPFCNPNMLNSASGRTGICSLRRAEPGDPCSKTSVVGLCDTSTTPAGNRPSSTCFGINGFDILDPDDPSPQPETGFCAAVCDPTAPDCSHVSDPGTGPGTCVQLFAARPDHGFCSNSCNSHLDRCARPGVMGQGSTCSGELSYEPGYPFTFCRTVMPPPISEWDWVNMPAGDCMNEPGGDARCEAHTRCYNAGSTGVCLRGCTVTSSLTGCEGGPNPTCDDGADSNPTDGLGLCR